MALNLSYNKNKLYRSLDYWSRDILHFNFWEKYVGLVSPPYSLYGFPRKMFLRLWSINWPNVIVWLPLLLEILANMCITIVCQPDCDVIKFEINLMFLIKPFCYMTKSSRQKFKYPETKRTFEVKWKAFFIISEGLSVAKNGLRPERAPWELLFYNNFT